MTSPMQAAVQGDGETLLLADVRPGDRLVVGDGFTCLSKGQIVKVAQYPGNRWLFVPCSLGKHRIDDHRGVGGALTGFTRGPNETAPAGSAK